MLSRRRKRAIIGTLGFGLLAAIILFAIGRFVANRALERELAEERATLVAPQPLVVPVVRATVERERSFAARGEPWSRAALAPEVGGTVIRLSAEVGQTVAAGEELAALDDTVARTSAAFARIQADEAARRQREVAQLVSAQAVATTDEASAAAAAEAAGQEAERAALLVAKHQLRAPFAGLVQARHVDRGDYLNPGQPAFELVDVSRLRVVWLAGEREVASFRPGADVAVQFPALPGESGTAIVRHVAPAAGASGLFRIEAELANPEARIPGGLAASVSATVRLYRDMLFVPTAAVRLEGARALVWVERPDAAPERVEIRIGQEVDGQFPVLSGLAEGDRLIIR